MLDTRHWGASNMSIPLWTALPDDRTADRLACLKPGAGMGAFQLRRRVFTGCRPNFTRRPDDFSGRPANFADVRTNFTGFSVNCTRRPNNSKECQVNCQGRRYKCTSNESALMRDLNLCRAGPDARRSSWTATRQTRERTSSLSGPCCTKMITGKKALTTAADDAAGAGLRCDAMPRGL